MVKKILSLHIPLSLNTALSSHPPTISSSYFCPLARRFPQIHAPRTIWLACSAGTVENIVSEWLKGQTHIIASALSGPHPESVRKFGLWRRVDRNWKKRKEKEREETNAPVQPELVARLRPSEKEFDSLCNGHRRSHRFLLATPKTSASD